MPTRNDRYLESTSPGPPVKAATRGNSPAVAWTLRLCPLIPDLENHAGRPDFWLSVASSFVITFVTALFREYRLLTNWATQIREHGPLAYRTAWRILGHAQDTEDVVQEAFVEMFRIGRQREILNWAGLLRTTVTCRALDRLRKNRKFSPLPDDVASRPGDSPDQAAESAELVAWLRSAIAELPPRQAEVFSLRHFADMSNGEIAAALKISPEAVAVALNKARTALAATRVPR